MKNSIIFYQLFEAQSSTYTYLLADPETKEAVLIDPVVENLERDIKWVHESGVKLKYVLDTHVHADHITAANELRQRLGVKTAVSSGSKVSCADILLEDGQELEFGQKTIRAITTPGHTDSCMSYYTEGMVFTGDALLIRGCGRTDFQQGSSEKLYDSVHQKLFTLSDDTIVYPGHDYRGLTASTIGMEKKYNPRLGLDKTKADFVKIMAELKLANPKKIAEAVPANMACGKTSSDRVLNPQLVDGVPEVSPAELARHKDQVRIIDVRRPEEFNNELGHIPGAELVTLGEDLSRFLRSSDRTQEIVFVCRSGGRSNQATVESQQLGYKKTVNLVGGMLRWNEENLPVERR
ncbi:MAG: MBL fold metallo-hydrolase [Oligoflexus sp.]